MSFYHIRCAFIKTEIELWDLRSAFTCFQPKLSFRICIVRSHVLNGCYGNSTLECGKCFNTSVMSLQI